MERHSKMRRAQLIDEKRAIVFTYPATPCTTLAIYVDPLSIFVTSIASLNCRALKIMARVYALHTRVIVIGFMNFYIFLHTHLNMTYIKCRLSIADTVLDSVMHIESDIESDIE